jgi:hypothetical protein
MNPYAIRSAWVYSNQKTSYIPHRSYRLRSARPLARFSVSPTEYTRHLCSALCLMNRVVLKAPTEYMWQAMIPAKIRASLPRGVVSAEISRIATDKV